MNERASSVDAAASVVVRALPSASARAGVLVSLVLLLIGFMSLVWTPHPIGDPAPASALLDPSLEHLLGTDAAGRDVVSVLMRSVLTSYVAAAIGVAIGIVVGVPAGYAAALANGLAGRLARLLGSTLGVIPALAVAAALATISGPSVLNVMAAIGVVSTLAFAQFTRASASRLLARDYVAASRLAGFGPFDAAARHVFPAMGPALLAQALVQLGYGVIAEATLSYAGLGARPDGASLGLMLRDLQSYVLFEPLLIVVPGFAIAAMAAALFTTASGLRRMLVADLGDMERDDAVT